jgi:cytochrome c-type biogenesis protein
MLLYFTSFIGGVLTVLAPCVLPVLPVILSGSLASNKKPILRPLVITASLAVSIVIFTIALKALTTFIAIPPSTWKIISGAIITIFGISLLAPNTWNKAMHKIGFEQKSQNALQSASKQDSLLGQILLGLSLGPVFASCSPTYSILIAVVFPISSTQAIINIAIYALGLSLMLFIIALLGRKIIKWCGIIAKPNSSFKKVLGTILVIVGIAIIFGIDKKIEAKILDSGYSGATQFERDLVKRVRGSLEQ